jgi:hypothetical protein
MVGTVRAEATADMVEAATADMVAAATADTVAAAMADMVAAAMADMVAAAMADTVAAAMGDTATAGGMDIASTLAAEAMVVTAMAADTGMDTAGEDIPAVVITDMIAATGAVAATTEAHIGAVLYSALDSAIFRDDRFATTRTDIRYRATCPHMTRTGIEVAGPGRPPYSYRRASTGSMRVARRAGSQTANRATAPSRMGTVVKVTDPRF